MDSILRFIIEGNPVSSKNEYSPGRAKDGRFFIYTRKDIKSYNSSAKFQLNAQKIKYKDIKLPLEQKLWVAFLFYPENLRRDFLNLLSCPPDLLQAVGIIRNDRNIGCIDGSRIVEVDKKRPRTEIIIRSYDERIFL